MRERHGSPSSVCVAPALLNDNHMKQPRRLPITSNLVTAYNYFSLLTCRFQYDRLTPGHVFRPVRITLLQGWCHRLSNYFPTYKQFIPTLSTNISRIYSRTLSLLTVSCHPYNQYALQSHISRATWSPCSRYQCITCGQPSLFHPH